MSTANPPRAVINMTYNGKQIEELVESFIYEDNAEGEGDTVSIEIENIKKEWFTSSMPKKNDKIKVKIKTYNWNSNSSNWGDTKTETLDCGTFLLDSFSFSGRPLMCSIKGISTPLDTEFKTKERTKTWENVTIEEIGQEIASNSSVKLVYEADEIKLKVFEQSGQADSDCLKSLCDEYGLYLKIYNNKLVVYDPSRYDEKGPKLTLTEEDMESWTWDTDTEGTYTGGTLDYTDPLEEEEYKAKVGKGPRLLKVNKKADDDDDAKKKISGEINLANRGTTKMTVNLRGNTNIVATDTVQINDLGKLSGKYFVEKATHTHGNNGYKTKLDLQKVEKKI